MSPSVSPTTGPLWEEYYQLLTNIFCIEFRVLMHGCHSFNFTQVWSKDIRLTMRHYWSGLYIDAAQGTVSIYRCHFTNIGIPMLKIRRSPDRLIFNMGIPYLGKTVFILRRGPGRKSSFKLVVRRSLVVHCIMSLIRKCIKGSCIDQVNHAEILPSSDSASCNSEVSGTKIKVHWF